ncbi:MAG: Na+/H+ antiporter NhaC family protein [Pseudomonadota bacterium]
MSTRNAAALRLSLATMAVSLAFLLAAAANAEVTVEAPSLVLTGVPFEVSVIVDPSTDYSSPEAFGVMAGEREYPLARSDDGTLVASDIVVDSGGEVAITVLSSSAPVATTTSTAVPGALSVLPPVLAIAIALIFRSVIPALFLGSWVGVWIASGLDGSAFFTSLLAVFQEHVRGAVADPDHAAIMLFTFMIGGMVGIISRNAGMQGVVDTISGWASNARRGQVSTALMGCVIFFDDYANTLVVGNTMRAVTDRLKISREKLAFLVDATAAPIACIALVTTWIGYEVGLIGAATELLDGFSESAYLVYLNTVPYSFYPIFMQVFVFMVAVSQRDFGAMYRAEERARTTGQLQAPGSVEEDASTEGRELIPSDNTPRRAVNAVVPVAVLLTGVIAGLLITGSDGTDKSLREIIGDGDSYKALMWASLSAVLVAAIMTVSQRLLTLEQTVSAWFSGIKLMMFAMIILVLAWTLGSITELVHTADFLVSLLGDWMPPGLAPAMVFVLAAATAFATGTSWGTMAILIPLVIPLTWAIMAANGMTDPSHHHILYSAIATVLTGAVWGDHCSPISDTTILSSLASGCDHIDHVRTQLPYALTTGSVALFVGTIPAGFGLPWWLAMAIGIAILAAFLKVMGRVAGDAPSQKQAGG